MGKGAFGRRHLRNSGRPGYGDRWVSCTGKPADVDNGGLAATATVAAGTLLGFQAREGVCVCTRVRGGFGVCVCVWRWARGVFEEMTRVLKILLRGSEMPGLLKIWMMVHHTWFGDNNRVL